MYRVGKMELTKIYETPTKTKKTIVLWVSRHPPLPVQKTALERAIGPIAMYQLSGTIPNTEYILDRVLELGAKYIVPVLPLSMIARLVELTRRHGITVLWAEMEQVKITSSEPRAGEDYDPESEVWIKGYEGTYKIMRFKRYHRIKAVKLELEEL